MTLKISLNDYVTGASGDRYMVCLHCQIRPELVQWHNTRLPTSARFADSIVCLCKTCWSQMSVAERLPYYRKEWMRDREILGEANAGPWQAIADAVWKGL